MNKNSKELVKKAVVFPLLAAAAVTAFMFSAMPFVRHYVPFYKSTLELSSFCTEKAESVQAAPAPAHNSAVNKSDITIPQSSSFIGSLSAGGYEAALAYDADYYNISKGASLRPGRLPGEVGAVYIYGYKSELAFLSELKAGDEITLSLFYGDYVFRVTNAETVSGEENVISANPGVSRGIVIYTDCGGAGISNDYYTVAAEMVSGASVEG